MRFFKKTAFVRIHESNFATGAFDTFWSVTLKVGPGRNDLENVGTEFSTEAEAVKAAKAAGAKKVVHV